MISFLFGLSLLCLLAQSTDIIEHIAPAVPVDDNVDLYDRCEINKFFHNETYTQDGLTFLPSSPYFFMSWSSKSRNNDDKSQILGDIFNSKHIYTKIGLYNDSLWITPDNINNNYHYITTSDFLSKPNDIIFSFYNEIDIEIHVFGSTASVFQSSTFRWSPDIPITGTKEKTNHSSNGYNLLHQSIQCIDGVNEEFILFVYEQNYNQSSTDIFMSRFNSQYLVKHYPQSINTVKGINEYPTVLLSLFNHRKIIIMYISNDITINGKIYNINDDDDLFDLRGEFSLIKNVNNYPIKYYNTIPLSIGGYIIIYSVINSNNIYMVYINEDGNRILYNPQDTNQDISIATESSDLLSHGTLIELNKINDYSTYILITYINSENHIMGEIYHINIKDTDSPEFHQEADAINLISIGKDVTVYHQCINYDELNNQIIYGWINSNSEYTYSAFAFNDPTKINHETTTTTTTTETIATEDNIIDYFGNDTSTTLSEKEQEEIALNTNDDETQIIIIVMVTAGCYCFIIAIITAIIIYLVNTGKLKFSIGYQQFDSPNKCGGFNDDDTDELELKFNDINNINSNNDNNNGDNDHANDADDEQTQDDDDDNNNNNNNNKNKIKQIIKKNKLKKLIKQKDVKYKVEMHQLIDQSD